MRIPEPGEPRTCHCRRCDEPAPACDTCGMEMAGNPWEGYRCPDCEEDTE
jgi:tRNA(Ile2) C34 agmatinyltransferase TiaS